MNQTQIVDLLEDFALLMELKGENVFKIRAYTNGARSLEGFDGDLADALATGALKQVKGIGAGLFADVRTLVTEGRLPAYDELKASIPTGVQEMLEIPGLGPKKVKAIYEGLGLTSIGELEYACSENRLVDLPGFGAKTQAKVQESIARWKRDRDKRLYADVIGEAEALLAAARKLAPGAQVELAACLRRQTEVVDSVMLVAETTEPAPLVTAFSALQAAIDPDNITPAGAEPGTVRLLCGLTATLVTASPSTFATTWLHLTGNVGFLEALAARAEALGLCLQSEGLSRGGKPVATATEADIFAALDMAPVPPELREGAAVVAAAVARALPTLVTDQEVQGVFHVHTRHSDGVATVREMVLKARSLGYRYIGISDHSEAAFYAHGLSREQITEQQAEIRALNEELDDITVLSGIEADILADGSLDYDDETLAGFDFVIGSVHSRFGQDEAAMTARLVKALSHPRLTMLGHMTGRLLLSRDAYAFDLAAVLDAAAAHGKIIELNANPHRLDIDWRDLGEAKRRGIPISINPDAHSPQGLEHTRYGVAMARKGGLEAGDVFNTQPIEAVLSALKR